MLFVLISLIILLLLILVAIRVSFSNKETTTPEEELNPVLHASGIYSIVRKNPREKIDQFKPSNEEIRKYLESINEISQQSVLDSREVIEGFIKNWNESLNKNIEIIDQGDNKGVSFYYYDFSPILCPVCSEYLKKGQFVTREEIYKYPKIIPPFHLGCTCKLVAYGGKENLHDTTEIGMVPFFKNEKFPTLPDWKMISHLNAVRGTNA